jgi:hypothetical protein
MDLGLQGKVALVTVASVATHTGAPHHVHHDATKAGLVNLSKSAISPAIDINGGRDLRQRLVQQHERRHHTIGEYA